MGKLRHIALAVPDIAASATFYEQAFGMQRVRQSEHAILMSDGVVSLAILDNKKSIEALGENGLHHFGFIADSVDDTAARAESAGAVYADKDERVAARFAGRGDMENGKIKEAAQKQDQRKYLDPNGVKFDIVNDEHARNSWRLKI